MAFPRRARSWVRDQFGRVLAFVYYDFLFESRSALSGEIAAHVRLWEQRRDRGDVPITKARWEEQYGSGHWDHLTAVGELGRFSVIAGYIRELKPNGAVLDVGCGEGLMFKRLQSHPVRYLGIDISATAIARTSSLEGGRFLCTDAEQYVPSETYDVILFNECLYYFKEPVATVARYATRLSRDGLVIVSTFRSSRRGRSILRALKRHFTVVDEIAVTHTTASWLCSVLSVPAVSPKP